VASVSRQAAARSVAAPVGVTGARAYHANVIDHYDNPRYVWTSYCRAIDCCRAVRAVVGCCNGCVGHVFIVFLYFLRRFVFFQFLLLTDTFLFVFWDLLLHCGCFLVAASYCVAYSTIRFLFLSPSFFFFARRNVGSMDKKDVNVGTGLVGAPACGDVMKLQIRVDPETGTITESVFKTFGCGSAIASSSLATEWIKGKGLAEAGSIKNRDIAKELRLPPVKLHCSMLAEDAIRAAIKDVKSKQAASVETVKVAAA